MAAFSKLFDLLSKLVAGAGVEALLMAACNTSEQLSAWLQTITPTSLLIDNLSQDARAF